MTARRMHFFPRLLLLLLYIISSCVCFTACFNAYGEHKVENRVKAIEETRATCAVARHCQGLCDVEEKKRKKMRKDYFSMYACFIYNSCLIIYFSRTHAHTAFHSADVHWMTGTIVMVYIL